jgi:glycosyltransferase involved in cell wall biosynthesis
MTRVDDSDSLADMRRRYNLPEHYILYLGTIHPAKNLRMLVAAYQRLKRTTGVTHDLVIAGRMGWLTRDIIETAREASGSAPVVFPGIVHEADKAALYSGADLFVSPSLYEGFGLTILEAMQCGTPVVSSNVTSIPEVTGDAAVLVDPRSEDELVHAMERVLGDKALGRRLSQKGLAQCRKFSWEKTARETAAAYEQVLGSA